MAHFPPIHSNFCWQLYPNQTNASVLSEQLKKQMQVLVLGEAKECGPLSFTQIAHRGKNPGSWFGFSCFTEWKTGEREAGLSISTHKSLYISVTATVVVSAGIFIDCKSNT